MTKLTRKLALAGAVTCLLASNAFAGSMVLSDSQMDSVAAGGKPTATGFICPVIPTDAVLHSVNSAEPQSGLYTIIGPSVAVPMGATNTLDDGSAGSPGGDYASPGDTGYTAIWYTGGGGG